MIKDQNTCFSQFQEEKPLKRKENTSFIDYTFKEKSAVKSNLQQAIGFDRIIQKPSFYQNRNEEKSKEIKKSLIDKKEVCLSLSSNGSEKTAKQTNSTNYSQIKNLSPKQSLNSANSIQKQFLDELNFSKIPLCCRTFFFDQQRILPGEDKVTEYKSYKFPFNPISFETFKKTICGFLNCCGGDIYIGVKETTNKKYRYVLGNYLTENDKEELIKTFRKIGQSIFPDATGNLQIQFVPIRSNPFPNIDLLGHCQTYFYDFTNKSLNLSNCPFLPGRYIVRVRISSGNKFNLYTYVETQYQLNKKSSSKQFVAFRSQNEVLVKEISNEVLKKFKNRLLYEQQKKFKLHTGPCLKPDIGNPKNQPQQSQDIVDAKSIQICLYQRNSKISNIQREKIVQKNKEEVKNQIHYVTNLSKNNQALQTNSESLKMIFRYPLSFIVNNISQQRLRKCILKTPSKDYTSIEKEKNILSGDDLLILTVNNYHNMEQFLRVKNSIQTFYKHEKVEFLPISNSIRLQNLENKKVAQALLGKNSKHKWVINRNVIEFYSLVVAGSFYLRSRQLGYEMQVIAK